MQEMFLRQCNKNSCSEGLRWGPRIVLKPTVSVGASNTSSERQQSLDFYLGKSLIKRISYRSTRRGTIDSIQSALLLNL